VRTKPPCLGRLFQIGKALSYLDDSESSEGKPPVVDPVLHLVLQIVASQKDDSGAGTAEKKNDGNAVQNKTESVPPHGITLLETPDEPKDSLPKRKKLSNKKHIKLLKTLMTAVDSHPRFRKLMQKKDTLVDELLDLLEDIVERFSRFPAGSIVWQLENVGTASPELLNEIRRQLRKHFEDVSEKDKGGEGAGLLVSHYTCEFAVLGLMGKLTDLRSISEDANAILSPIFGGNLPANMADKFRQSTNSSLFFLKNLRGMEACTKTVQDLQSLADALGIEKTVHGREAATQKRERRESDERDDVTSRVLEMFSEIDLNDLVPPSRIQEVD
jgi:hypothetical protein